MNDTDVGNEDDSKGEQPRVRRESTSCDGISSEARDGEDEDDNDEDNSRSGDTDDVHLSFSHSGHVFEWSSQVEDYKFCAEELSHVSVWDFVSTVDQIPKLVDRTDEDCDEEPDENEDIDSLPASDCGKRIGPYKLQVEHRDYNGKVQRVRTHQWKHFVPIPIGPVLPRRDRAELYPKYSQLMLVLFKPWCTEADL